MTFILAFFFLFFKKNVCLPAEGKLKSMGDPLNQLLSDWIQSEDNLLSSDAIRARSSLAALGTALDLFICLFVLKKKKYSGLKSPKYSEGIYLLYPYLGVDHHGSPPTKLSPPEIDIVFIHGVTGHPFNTVSSAQLVQSL